MPSEPQDMGRQLNPFAFPSETKGRFLMLTLAALAFGDNLATLLCVAFTGLAGRYRALGTTFNGMVKRHWKSDPLAAGSTDVMAAAVDGAAAIKKFQLLMLEFAGFPLLIVALLATLAIILYRSHGTRLKRRYSVRPLRRAEAPNVVADLEACAARQGMSLPSLAWSPGLAQGHAFGLRGQEMLLLHGSPEVLEKSWGEPSQAIAFHELAHVANGDAGDREKAKSVWIVFIGFLVPGLAVLSLALRSPGIVVLRSAAMVLFVWSLGAGLIRVREFYADWRASSWGAKTGLQRILSLPEGEMQKWERWDWWWRAWERWGERGWWRLLWGLMERTWSGAGRLLRLHPSFAERRAVLDDSWKLFQISPDLSFLTGGLLAVVLVGGFFFYAKVFGLVLLILGFLNAKALEALGGMTAGVGRNALLVMMNLTIFFILFLTATAMLLSVAYLITKTIGIQVQRRAAAQLAMRSSRTWGYARLLGAAFLIGLGLETGFLLAPFSLLAPGSAESWVAMPVWLALSTALMWLWLAYVHGVSRFLLGSYVGEADPRRRRAFVTWSSAGLLTVLFWPMALARASVRVSHLLSSREALPQGVDPQEFFIYGFFMTTIVLLMISVAVYLLWILATLAALWVAPLQSRGHCPYCKAETRYVLSLGRSCGHCGESLTPWIFLSKARTAFAAES